MLFKPEGPVLRTEWGAGYPVAPAARGPSPPWGGVGPPAVSGALGSPPPPGVRCSPAAAGRYGSWGGEGSRIGQASPQRRPSLQAAPCFSPSRRPRRPAAFPTSVARGPLAARRGVTVPCGPLRPLGRWVGSVSSRSCTSSATVWAACGMFPTIMRPCPSCLYPLLTTRKFQGKSWARSRLGNPEEMHGTAGDVQLVGNAVHRPKHIVRIHFQGLLYGRD